MTEEMPVGTPNMGPTPNVPAPSGASALSGAGVPSPKSKLFTVLGGFLVVAVVAAAGYFYVWPRFMGPAQPPSLEIDTSGLAKGMASDPTKGYAMFEDKDFTDYKCGEGVTPADGFMDLKKGANYLYVTDMATFKDLFSALKPDKELKFLFAFYTPGETMKTVDGKEITKYDAPGGFYVFPTGKSPYKHDGAWKVSDVTVDNAVKDGVKYTIPANRGFVLFVNKDAKLCRVSKAFHDASYTFPDKLEPTAVATIVKNVAESTGVLPQGWVMVPSFGSADFMTYFLDKFGEYVDTDSIWVQKANGAVLVSLADVKAGKVKDGLMWFDMDQTVDLVKVLKEKTGEDKPKEEIPAEGPELKDAVWGTTRMIVLTFSEPVKVVAADQLAQFNVFWKDGHGENPVVIHEFVIPTANPEQIKLMLTGEIKDAATKDYYVRVFAVAADKEGGQYVKGYDPKIPEKGVEMKIRKYDTVAPIVDKLDYSKHPDGLGYVNVHFSENVVAADKITPLFDVRKVGEDSGFQNTVDFDAAKNKENVLLKFDPALGEGKYVLVEVKGVVDESGNSVAEDLRGSVTEFTVPKAPGSVVSLSIASDSPKTVDVASGDKNILLMKVQLQSISGGPVSIKGLHFVLKGVEEEGLYVSDLFDGITVKFLKCGVAETAIGHNEVDEKSIEFTSSCEINTEQLEVLSIYGDVGTTPKISQAVPSLVGLVPSGENGGFTVTGLPLDGATVMVTEPAEPVLAKVLKAEWMGDDNNKIAITFDSVVYDRDGEVVKLYRVKSDGSKGGEVPFVPPYSISFKDGAHFGNVVYVTSGGTIPGGEYIIEAYGFTDETETSNDVVDPYNNSAKFTVAAPAGAEPVLAKVLGAEIIVSHGEKILVVEFDQVVDFTAFSGNIPSPADGFEVYSVKDGEEVGEALSIDHVDATKVETAKVYFANKDLPAGSYVVEVDLKDASGKSVVGSTANSANFVVE